MPANFFDFAIIGGDLCGVLFGALAAKKGKRVAIIENGEGAAWDVVDGVPLPVQPQWVYGVESSPLVKGVLNELDIFLQVRNRLIRLRPALQLLSQRYRVDLDEQEALRAEFEREFPGQADPDLDWIQKLLLLDGEFCQILERTPVVPPDSWGEKRGLSRLLTDHPVLGENLAGSPFDRATTLLPYLKAYQPFFTHCTVEPASAYPFLRVAKGLLDGLYTVDGDLPDFRSFFLDVVRRKSGLVVTEHAVSSLDVRRGRIAEIHLRGAKDSVGAETVLCNMDLRRFLQMIPPEEQKEKYHQRVLMMRPSGYLYPLALVVKGDVFLEGAGPHLLFDPAWVQQPLMLYIPRQQPSTERTVVLALTWIPGSELTLQEAYLERVEKRVLEAVQRVHPFLPELTVKRLRVGLDESGAVHAGRFFPVYPLTEERNLGINDLNPETPYKNLFLASRFFYAGLGFEGAFLGARVLANKLLA
jgi:phytoene dehydrogenase-like protein